jgi:hypothetical protein
MPGSTTSTQQQAAPGLIRACTLPLNAAGREQEERQGCQGRRLAAAPVYCARACIAYTSTHQADEVGIFFSGPLVSPDVGVDLQISSRLHTSQHVDPGWRVASWGWWGGACQAPQARSQFTASTCPAQSIMRQLPVMSGRPRMLVSAMHAAHRGEAGGVTQQGAPMDV